jgi:hypothetical protein
MVIAIPNLLVLLAFLLAVGLLAALLVVFAFAKLLRSSAG